MVNGRASWRWFSERSLTERLINLVLKMPVLGKKRLSGLQRIPQCLMAKSLPESSRDTCAQLGFIRCYQTEIDFAFHVDLSPRPSLHLLQRRLGLMLDKLLAHMGDKDRFIFVNANIDKGSEINHIAHNNFWPMWRSLISKISRTEHWCIKGIPHKSRPGFRRSAMISFRFPAQF